MKKQLAFLITATVLMTAIVTVALYTVNVNAQAPAGGNMTAGKNMTAGAANMTKNATGAMAGAVKNATGAMAGAVKNATD